MKVFVKNIEVQSFVNNLKAQNKTIGFVPTMGALHEGHLSLIEKSKLSADVTIVSIFVNPTQFNDKSDYKNYPRNNEKDLLMLNEVNCDAVFIPTEDEVYPTEDKRVFDLGFLETVMEGSYRKGHFQGVAKVVSRLFEIVKPDKAFFGQKDFQQLAVIKKLVEILSYNIEIVECETKREPHGLAMSSRNQLLSKENFENAAIIYRTISNIGENIRKKSILEIKTEVSNKINSSSEFKLEYVEVVNAKTLEPINSIENQAEIVCCVAVYCGKVRLIDNVRIIL